MSIRNGIRCPFQMGQVSSNKDTPGRTIRFIPGGIVWIWILLLTASVWAQTGTDDRADVRTRVLRIQYLDGTATIQRVYGEAHSATVNDVLTEGDVLVTESGRVELSLGNGTFIRVDRYTTLEVSALQGTTLNEADVLLQLRVGAIYLDTQGTRRLNARVQLRVDTPDVSVWIDEPALVRVDASPENGTYVRVQSGAATLLHDRGELRISAGQAVLGVRPEELPVPQVVHTFSGDSFDEWNTERRRAWTGMGIEDYLPEDLYFEGRELEAYGRWERHAQFGYVWIPPIHAPWFPYTYGHWVWVNGWFWVPYEPWGWVTHHYGWWYFDVHLGWIWIPRPVFRYAWVTWYHHGPYVGWCPLTIGYRPLTFVNVHFDVYTFFPITYWDPVGRPWIFVHESALLHRPVHRYRLTRTHWSHADIRIRTPSTHLPPPWRLDHVRTRVSVPPGWRIEGDRLVRAQPISRIERTRTVTATTAYRARQRTARPSDGAVERIRPRTRPAPVYRTLPRPSRDGMRMRETPSERVHRQNMGTIGRATRRHPPPQYRASDGRTRAPSDTWNRSRDRWVRPQPAEREPGIRRDVPDRPDRSIRTREHADRLWERPADRNVRRSEPRFREQIRERSRDPVYWLMEGLRRWTRPTREWTRPRQTSPRPEYRTQSRSAYRSHSRASVRSRSHHRSIPRSHRSTHRTRPRTRP